MEGGEGGGGGGARDHIYASPLRDPRVLALFGRNPLKYDSRLFWSYSEGTPSNMIRAFLVLFGKEPLQYDSRVWVVFGKDPLRYDSTNPKEPFHSTALPENPWYPHHLQYHVYAVCVNPCVCLYAYGTRVMDTKHKLSEGGMYEYKRARPHLYIYICTYIYVCIYI